MRFRGLNPRSLLGQADAHNNLGLSLFELGEFDEAVEEFMKAFHLNPGTRTP